MKITITGANGTLGTALIERLKDNEITCLGHSEFKTVPKMSNGHKWVIGDITDSEFTDANIKGDLIIHCAAQKVIPIAEQNVSFAFKTNVIGTINVFESAIKNNVKEVIFISTDKSYNPETAYGKTKEIGNWLCEYYNKKQSGTSFYWVLYGNVLASNMSVFSIWDKLGKEGKDIEVTVPEMTRFFFTLDSAVVTVLKALDIKGKSKPYIPDMKSISMGEAAEIFAEHYGIKVNVVGNRGMEKIHEGMSDEYNSETCEHYNKEEFTNILKQIGCLK